MLNLHNACRLAQLHASSGISSVVHHNPHINAIFVYLLMNELFVDKIHFFKFLSMSQKAQLYQLKIALLVQYKLFWCLNLYIHTGTCHQGRGNTMCCEQRQSVTNLLLSRLKLLFRSLTFISQIFVRYLRKWSKPKYLKAEALQVPQKIQTMLVWYHLYRIRILLYSCTGCGTSKIYFGLENNNSLFSRRSLKSETKDTRP